MRRLLRYSPMSTVSRGRYRPESVSVKSEASENAGVMVCHAVSSRQPRVNLAVMPITTLKPETEQPCSLSSKIEETVVPFAVVP
jgi:hypothetical protein